jgi:hypothetical protein
MSRLWLINGWRQQYASQKQLLAGIAEAKLLGFDSYCSHRYGQQWWLCCAPIGARQQQQQDIVTALRQQFQPSQQVLVVLQYSTQWICVGWDHQQLVAALAVTNDESGCQQLQLVLQGLWQRPGFQPLCLLSSDVPDLLQRQFELAPRQRIQQFSLAQLQPAKAAQLLGLDQLPSWRRRRQLVIITVILVNMMSALSWHYWPRQDEFDSALDSSPVRLPVEGMAADSLVYIREQLQQLELLGGWQVEQLTLRNDQVQVILQQHYGRFGELQQQLPPPWQISQAAQQVQLQRALPALSADLEFHQPLPLAQQQLKQQALQLFPDLHWQLGHSGSNSQYQWQDLSLRVSSWYWLELSDLQQLLQSFDVRLLELQLSRQSQPQIAMQLRLYQAQLATDTPL